MNHPLLPAGVQVFERGWLSANNILLTAGEQSVLVDSGYCSHAPQTLQLVEAGLAGQPLDILVNTHLHSDHCGGNAALQMQYPQLKTWIPPGQAGHVKDWDPVALTYSPTGQLCPRFQFDRTLQPGAEIPAGNVRWEVHAAPGHDPHSLIFFEPASRTLISADALWENGFGVVFPELEGADAFTDVAATLAVIESLQPKTVIPGHGKVFAYSPEVLLRARQRLEAFVKSPKKHAHHAAKVLLKFKLLETQRQNFDEFSLWAESTPYFAQIREQFFDGDAMRPWIAQLCEELVRAGVAARDGTFILNT